MEVSSITVTEARKTYRWENRLSFEDRKKIIELYIQGYAVWNLANTFHVASTTLEWHLKEAGIYTPKRKTQPTFRNKPISIYRAQARFLALPAPKVIPEPLRRIHVLLEEDDRRTTEMQQSFPRSYKEYLARAKKRHPGCYNGNYAETFNHMSAGGYPFY